MSSLQEQHSFSKQYGSCTFIPSQKKWPYQVGGGPEPEVPSMEPEVPWMEFGSHVSEQTDRRMPHLALRSQEFVTNIFSEGSKIFHPTPRMSPRQESAYWGLEPLAAHCVNTVLVNTATPSPWSTAHSCFLPTRQSWTIDTGIYSKG